MTKKILLSAAAAMFLSLVVSPAQEKIRQVVSSDYNRNSISVVAVERGDSYDSQVRNAVNGLNLGEKYDINKIPTKAVRLSKYRSESSTQEEIDALVASKSFGTEILGSIFNRDSRGMMDDKTVRYRGNYDAKDQDVINARASRVGVDALGDLGHKLVSNSYIVLFDYFKIDRYTDRNGKTTWSTNAKAYAYRIGMSPERLNDFYEQCWIYEEDDQATRDSKINAFRNFAIDMEPVATVSNSGAGSDVQAAAASCLGALINSLENRISDWEVAVTILSKHPLQAKIGTKEGLGNGDRYRAYSYREDKNGNLVSVKRGYLRATEIASNTGMALGDTEPSKFYQVSGIANIDEGWTIKQSNDYKIGAMLGLKVGGINKTTLAVDMDYLVNLKTSGSASYVLFGFGLDVGKTGDYACFNLGLGYGYGLHFTRFFEFMPYATVGMDHISLSNTDSDDNRFLRSSALVLEPGVKAALNVAYPLQVYAKVCYDLLIYGQTVNDIYYRYNQALATYYDNEHHSGLGIQFGVKWTF